MATSKSFALVKMARPLIVLAGVLAYILGAAMAFNDSGGLDLAAALLGLLILITAVMMGHYADEYSDFDTDSRTKRTMISGGSGVLQSGQVPLKLALESALVSLGLTLTLTFIGVAAHILPPIVAPIVALGLVGGWTYSMPPARLIRRGWGEVDNAILGGFLMPLLGFASQTGAVTPKALIWCAPVSLVVMANLLGIHWADMSADTQSGKLTLVVRLGHRVKPLHLILIAATYGLVFALTPTWFPTEVSLTTAITLPLGIYSAYAFMRKPSPLPGAFTMVAMIIAMTIGWVLA